MKDKAAKAMRTIGSLTLCRSLLKAGLADRFRPAAQERSAAASLNTAAGSAGHPRDRASHLQALAVPGTCGACGSGSLGKDADAEAVARTGALSAAGIP
jgi:hypothetical protein